MNVEIGTEAAQFPEKEYISGIFLAVYVSRDPAQLVLVSLFLSLRDSLQKTFFTFLIFRSEF